MIKRISQSFTYWYLFLISYPTFWHDIIDSDFLGQVTLGYLLDFIIYSFLLLFIFIPILIDKHYKPIKKEILQKILLILFYFSLPVTLFVFYKWSATILFMITYELGFPIELNVTFLKPVFFWIKTMLSL